ncbi:hypothetical protein AWB74_01630 [Caballeronia arvi]|uniref:Uncharacterized protein n=1 Tax=Caballeronia arvi TaxID=1777135 RepID=A0A158HAA0_9BURK|nr:hypothetical protein AWB74_01630 [Caballeronia arvi]
MRPACAPESEPWDNAKASEMLGSVIKNTSTNKEDAFPRVIHSSAWIIKVYVCSMSLRMATLLM